MQIELNQVFKGMCLVASPSMNDDLFENSVIYITEHSSISGAVGVMINKTLVPKPHTSADLGAALSRFGWSNIPVYLGGPVELASGFVLHQRQNETAWLLTGSVRQIEQLASDGHVKPLMLTAGYCMWDSFQLEREVRSHHWLIVPGDANLLLANFPAHKRYQEALRLAGISNLAHFDFNGGGNA